MMKTLLTAIQDGQGNASTTRIVVLLIVLSILAPKVYLSFKVGAPLTWNADDLTMLGMALGAKLVQNTQENAGAAGGPPLPPS